MGCVGSSPAANDAGGPSSSAGTWSLGPRPARVWAKGVGTAFEFLNEHRQWEPIVDPFVINQLGKLCAYNSTTEVTYDGRNNGQSYKTIQQPDGMLAQTNIRTGVTRHIRLVPFFFEFKEGPSDWRPVTDPKALMALTAVLASSLPKQYTYRSATTHDDHKAETTLIGEKGLLQQRNLATQKKRCSAIKLSRRTPYVRAGSATCSTCMYCLRTPANHRSHACVQLLCVVDRHIRPTPIGPDGQPHFEFLDDDGWKPVSEVCVKQLAAVAVGRGDAFYDIKHVAGKAAGSTFHYQAKLGEDGFIVQTNTSTRAERQVRPAPWIGHGRGGNVGASLGGMFDRFMGREGGIRADPTNGYYPGREEIEGASPSYPQQARQVEPRPLHYTLA